MIMWRLNELSCGKVVLELAGDDSGDCFMLGFPDIGRLKAFVLALSSKIGDMWPDKASLEAMSAFVSEFPEMF